MRISFRLRTSASVPPVHTPRIPGLFAAILILSLTAFAQAQNYTSIVVFGDSLSDIGNVTDLTLSKYQIPIPSPVVDYTYGRFTDGFDTAPAAHNFRGVWVEQLASMLPAHPVLTASLNGGTDFAYGSATTGGGTSPVTLSNAPNAPFVNVDNVGLQISTYLATHPRIDSKTLFIVWAGAIDVLHATRPEDVVDAAIQQTENIHRLMEAGATQFLVPNLPPLGAIPRFQSMPTGALTATEGSILYNVTLAAGLDILRFFSFGRVHLRQLDVFNLFKQVIGSPSAYSLENVTSMSRGDLAVNPDTFLFWDDLHPTTRGHNILALAADKLLNPNTHQEELPSAQPQVALR